MKRMAAMVLCMLMMAVPASAEEPSAPEARTARDIIEELAVYYGTYGSEAERKISELLDELRASHRKAPEISAESEKKPFEPATSPMLKIGDICPECGQATVISEEGCRKCYSCGYSEC